MEHGTTQVGAEVGREEEERGSLVDVSGGGKKTVKEANVAAILTLSDDFSLGGDGKGWEGYRLHWGKTGGEICCRKTRGNGRFALSRWGFRRVERTAEEGDDDDDACTGRSRIKSRSKSRSRSSFRCSRLAHNVILLSFTPETKYFERREAFGRQKVIKVK